MRIVYENRFTVFNENYSDEKHVEFRVTIGGHGFEKETAVEILANISDQVIEKMVKDEEEEPEEDAEEMQIDSLQKKFKKERKRWIR